MVVPAFLLLLVAGSVAWAINDPGLYRNGFERYGISQRTGITDADLDRIGGELRTYFNTGTEPLDVRAPVYGVEQPIFNDREIAHMYDVKRLIRGTYWVAIGAAAWIVVVAATGFASPTTELHSNCRARGSVGRRRHRRQPVRIRIGGSHRVRATLSALPPAQLRQRPVDSRPEHRLPTDNVPRRLLVQRHHTRRTDCGVGRSSAAGSGHCHPFVSPLGGIARASR